MSIRRKHFDVSNTVDTTNPSHVNEAIDGIFRELFPEFSTEVVDNCFAEVTRLYLGQHPSYRACDTPYHNLQHILDVSLAMARLMDGYERTRGCGKSLGPRRFAFGIITALLHDVGYLRHSKDTKSINGAQYTLVHVSRSARFVESYMSEIGMNDLAPAAKAIIHFTGYEKPSDRIRVPDNMFRLLGHMLGSADIMAQMADRCYLEKCRDRLFTEFVHGGLVDVGERGKFIGPLFTSAEDLLYKTPRFYKSALARLNDNLGEVHKYVQKHFNGQNLYIEEMEKNNEHASKVANERDLSLLRRTPPSHDSDDTGSGDR